jgi:hypothetical protein
MKTLIKNGADFFHKKTVVPLADLILGKAMSKKLMVFFIATAFVIFKHIDPENWVRIAEIYIGSQALVDGVVAYKGNKKDFKIKPGDEDL